MLEEVQDLQQNPYPGMSRCHCCFPLVRLGCQRAWTCQLTETSNMLGLWSRSGVAFMALFCHLTASLLRMNEPCCHVSVVADVPIVACARSRPTFRSAVSSWV
jgi:hypothetical protein